MTTLDYYGRIITALAEITRLSEDEAGRISREAVMDAVVTIRRAADELEAAEMARRQVSRVVEDGGLEIAMRTVANGTLLQNRYTLRRNQWLGSEAPEGTASAAAFAAAQIALELYRAVQAANKEPKK